MKDALTKQSNRSASVEGESEANREILAMIVRLKLSFVAEQYVKIGKRETVVRNRATWMLWNYCIWGNTEILTLALRYGAELETLTTPDSSHSHLLDPTRRIEDF